jgi:serine/threonine protein kinase
MKGERIDIKSVFLEALEKRTPEERRVYLAQVCGASPELRTEFESLLQAHEAAGDFLEAPPVGESIALDESGLTEGPGTGIGHYKLLEKIGEGGMAVVYMAEQTEPIRRKVALKIIKLGMDTRQVIARFEAERQALALMDHPSIAKVLDAGATETGRPYFVMELVQGVSITEYCDKNSLSTKDRLALFLQVCHAVQHAHQRGVIHRDVKPSNVMVTHHDGKPVPKVIDFGIAKATNQRLTEKTLFTRYAHIIGTPAYMSPEQAELSDLDIDTRSDIYSLGVLLYELLTGTTPFSEEELHKAGYIEMQRVIREQEPAKPSTKLSTLGETLAGVAKHRNSTPDLLTKALRGDLDWIVMKSLEKDRCRRYEAAEALALDIQRHLEHRPVLARAPSKGYRLHKFLRRHRAQAVTGVAFAGLIAVVAVVLSIWNRDRVQLAQMEGRRHQEILSQARQQFVKPDHEKALETIESILDSKHVGPAARVLKDQILEDLQEKVSQRTQRIEADPLEASAYSDRAHYYDCLHDRPRALADMRCWSVIQRQRAFWDSWFGAAWDFRHVIDGPSDYQIVFSGKRPVNKTPELSIAFGQKGRWEMKLFEIPMFVMSLVGFGLFSGLDTAPSYADFTFGEPVNLKTTIPALDPLHDLIVECLSPDGLEMYIMSDRPGGYGSIDLCVLRRASPSDSWGPPANLGPAVNSPKDDGRACISADGLTLYFMSNRPGGGNNDWNVYTATRASQSAPWGPAVKMGLKINAPGTASMSPWVSTDGLELYFASKRAGGYGNFDIYVVKRATLNEPWSDPVNLGPVVNSPYFEGHLSLSPDGLLLFFCDDNLNTPRPGGYGRADMWMARRASLSDPWQAPVNLGPQVNGPAFDFAPRISPDGRTLYFWSGLIENSSTWNTWQAPIIPVVDFNGDGKVDANDQAVLVSHLGQNYPLCDIAPFAWGNGIVDANDLAVLSDYIGKELVDPTLLAHWPLDESAGSVAMDWVGGHDAMVVGNVVWQPAGKVGGALAFDGKTTFARTVSPALDPSSGPFSVIAWVKGGAANRVIMSQFGAADWLYLNQFGMLTTDLKASGPSGISLTSDAYLLDDQWHRVAFVWDGMNRALHVDGVEVARDTQPNLAAGSGNLQIGCGQSVAPTTFWTGLIDDVRVYSRAVAP